MPGHEKAALALAGKMPVPLGSIFLLPGSESKYRMISWVCRWSLTIYGDLQKFDRQSRGYGDQMKTAYFDCSYGIAGDMILGALVDAGAPFSKLKSGIEKDLGVSGIRLSRRKVMRYGIAGTRVLVRVDVSHDHHRHLGQIEEIIERSSLPQSVKTRSIEAYRALARAEAKVHNTTPDHIHFHEVGCLDAIADVAGSMLAFELLGVERVESSPLVVGSGKAHCAHGIIPVPGPATVELLRGAPFEAGPFPMEMTTPTGAAILTTLAAGYGPQPLMTLESVGQGAGKREIEGHANFLRVLIGETFSPPSGTGTPKDAGPEKSPLPSDVKATPLVLLMTEIDDMSPELLGDLLEKLFAAKCLDAHFTSIQMKKNRPGTQIQVLCQPGQKDHLIEIILRNTSTFGLKVMDLNRVCLARRMEKIKTSLGTLEVKIGLWGGEVLKVTPEYENCRRLAESSGLPLAEVYRRVQVEIENHYFAGSARKGKRP